MSNIIKIEPLFLRYRFPPSATYVYSGGLVENMDAALVRVTCEDGECGIGEITHGQFCYEPIVALIEHFDRLLHGQSVKDINRIWSTMYDSSVFWNRQGVGIGVMGGIDIALHDVLGKLLDIPVYQLLGGLQRSRIRGYASNGLFDDSANLLADAERARRFGFTAYKMRVVTPDSVIPLVAAFKKEFNDMDLIVDAVQGSCAVPWSVAVSKRIAKELEGYGVLWFEEPCRVEDMAGYIEMRRSTRLNIAGAESLPTAHAFKPYLEQGAFGLVQFDIATSGFSEGRRIADLAAVHRKPVAIHSWGTVVSGLAGLHLALTLSNCAMTEYCFMDQPFNDKFSRVPLRPEAGYFHAPQGPGLGISFDDALLTEYPYEATVNTMVATGDADIQLM